MAQAIEAKVWRHTSGRTASVCGACPWTSEAERAAWALVVVGWTIQHADGTRGIGRVPFKTREEAQAWIDAHPRFPGMSQG
jgi:hypothetical protein